MQYYIKRIKYFFTSLPTYLLFILLLPFMIIGISYLIPNDEREETAQEKLSIIKRLKKKL
jgi:hypothetical protein